VRHDEPRGGSTATLVALTLASASFSLQQTSVIPALPVIQEELDVDTAWMPWLVTAFYLGCSAMTPLAGRLGDQYGRKRLLIITLSTFLVGSTAAALAPNLGVLLCARALQGFGGGIMPLAFAIVKDEFAPDRVGPAVRAITAVHAAGAAFGLALFGIVVEHLSWRVSFACGAVWLAATIGLVWLAVPRSSGRVRARPDVAGATLLAVGLLTFMIALTEGADWGWTSPAIVALLAGCVATFAVWTRIELRVSEPMLDIRMLTRRVILLTNTVAFASGYLSSCWFVILPTLLAAPFGLPPEMARLVDYGFGADPTTIGLYLTPAAVSGVAAVALTGILVRRFGLKAALMAGMSIGMVGAASLAVWHDQAWQVVLGMAAIGGTGPMVVAAGANLIVDAVLPTETGAATGVNFVVRMCGGVVGGQIIGAVLAARPIPGTTLPTEAAITTAFWIGAVMAALGAIAALHVTARGRAMRLLVPDAAEPRATP
jgi:MFS family permease